MCLVRAEQTRVIEVEQGLFGIKLVDGETGARGVALLRGWLHPGACHSPHTHDAEEAVVFLSGHGVVRIEGESFEAGPGDAFLIPPRVIHSAENTGDVDLEFVAAFSDQLIASRPAGAASQLGRRRALRRPLVLNRLRWAARRILGRLGLSGVGAARHGAKGERRPRA
jgi:quercetin dioxygenase-like cupin family protein